MKLHVTVNKYPDTVKFTVDKLDLQQVQGALKLAEKFNENQKSVFPTISAKVER